MESDLALELFHRAYRFSVNPEGAMRKHILL